jgi:hypothetical protein
MNERINALAACAVGDRIQDPNRPQRTMMLGIGFRERDTALDFKQTLNDYVRFVDRMAAAAAYAASGLSVSGNIYEYTPHLCGRTVHTVFAIHACVHL